MLSSISVNEGDEVSIVCNSEGIGSLTVNWKKANGSSLPPGVHQNGKELIIAAATRYHTGTYVCIVSNLAGEDETTATVIVHCRYP